MGDAVFRIGNLRLSLCILSFIDMHLLRFGSFDKNVLNHLDKFLSKGGLFIDVGANIGYYTCYAAQKAGVRVIAFEPSPREYKRLLKNIELNKLSNVTAIPAALGNAKNTATLNLGDLTNPGINSFNPISQHNGSVAVPVVRMDEKITANQMQLAKLVKLDVEGHEWPALQGMENLWHSCAAALLIEMNENKEKIYAYLEARGYTTAEALQPTLQYDALFVKK